MENIWGCAWHRTAGLFGTSTGYSYKLTHGTVDGSTATSFGTKVSGYISINTAKPETGFVTKMLFGKHGMLPSAATGGSATTYYSDYYYDGTGFSLIGGAVNADNACGFGMTLLNDSSSARWSIATSLSLKPRAKVPYNPDWDNRPAHQFVNNQCIDIPTHHFINGRWQGELTSQSPLKFRADGEMLDWRVEGASGGVGDWDETAQRYKIPVRVESENLFDGVLPSVDTSLRYIDVEVGEGTFTLSSDVPKTPNGFATLFLLPSSGVSPSTETNGVWDGMPRTIETDRYVKIGYRILENINPADYTINLNEGSIAFPHTTTLFTDHQLMDGDSIDYATDQTAIPIATGNSTLTVDTAVQPKSVFVKFEG